MDDVRPVPEIDRRPGGIVPVISIQDQLSQRWKPFRARRLSKPRFRKNWGCFCLRDKVKLLEIGLCEEQVSNVRVPIMPLIPFLNLESDQPLRWEPRELRWLEKRINSIEVEVYHRPALR